MGKEDLNRQQMITHLYEHILALTNRYLHKAQTFSIQVLALEDPSFAAMAKQLRGVCNIVKLMCEVEPIRADNPLTSQKAEEYCRLVEKMAEAITSDNEALLQEVIDCLDRKPFL